MSTMQGVLKKIGHSLSARLVLIFFIAAMAYGYAGRYAFTLFQDTDYLRRIAGAHTALHTDYILQDIGSPPSVERAQAIEWVVYQALRSSDKYVWFYNQRCQYLSNLNVAPEMPPAIERARRKVANNEEIGFDMAPIWE